MSWQRIDENTYIDNTLVTCAEYQLFIDEMREQGKYYQLDHWASHQFPEGLAREPILGMRYSDAMAFCEWLTRREQEKWTYRLSTGIEAILTTGTNCGFKLELFGSLIKSPNDHPTSTYARDFERNSLPSL